MADMDRWSKWHERKGTKMPDPIATYEEEHVFNKDGDVIEKCNWRINGDDVDE